MAQLSEKRYFIAILPPNELMNEVENVKVDFAENYQSKGAKNAPAHITLHMPFLWKEEKEKQLIFALSELQINNKTFEIYLNNFSHFQDRVIFIDVKISDSLKKIQKDVIECMKRLFIFNQLEDKRGFHPHITVAFRDLKKEQFEKAWKVYKDKKFENNFTCSSFSLMRKENNFWEEIFTFNLNEK